MKPPTLKTVAGVTIAAAVACAVPHSRLMHAQEAPPRFSAGVTLVPITAVVRDSRNRIVRDLGRDDFHVLEQGVPRPIVDFRAQDDAPISVAFLFDTSGSMPVASNLEKGRGFVERFLSQVRPTTDEIALFTFDKILRQEIPFTTDRNRIRVALDRVKAWGLTSLYDAIAGTAREVAARPSGPRAVVVITDGDDTSSTLTPAEVSGLASAIDVPVYVVAVVSPLDHPGNTAAVVPDQADGALSNLAYWTGGEPAVRQRTGTEPARSRRELLAAMRQQYSPGH